jgi:hypothetical protein
MSSWTAEIRRRAAEEKRAERQSRQRQQELERCLKEQARLSEQERARLEVEAYENALTVLLSIHKEQSAPMDWHSYAAALPSAEPAGSNRHEFAAMLKFGVSPCRNAEGKATAAAEVARVLDQRDLQTALIEHNTALAAWARMRALAKRVLAGDAVAYSEAILEFSTLGELDSIGSLVRTTVHSPRLLECSLKVNGQQTLPQEVKSLTASGKLSVKAMPKVRAHELYQDYICGCVLRVGREMLALLPVEHVLVTASASEEDALDERPVLSVAIERGKVEQLDFEGLDPSDSLDHFLHRGDAKLSRKSGEFVPIVPLTPTDLQLPESQRTSFAQLLNNIRALRAEIDGRLPRSPSPAETGGAETIPRA